MGTDAHEEVVHGVHIGALAGAEAHGWSPTRSCSDLVGSVRFMNYPG